jgi:hypothetical protein
MIKAKKALLLAGASAFAILVGAAAVNAETGRYDFVVPPSGNYFLFVSGASGGTVNSLGAIGGLGAGVEGSLFLTAGEHLTLFAGGMGANGVNGAGGGGGAGVKGLGGATGINGGGVAARPFRPRLGTASGTAMATAVTGAAAPAAAMAILAAAKAVVSPAAGAATSAPLLLLAAMVEAAAVRIFRAR